MSAIGVPMAGRGARADEYLDAMEALWRTPATEYHGRYVEFAGVEAYPKPVRGARPKIALAGYTAASHRRAVRRGDGWYGFFLDPDAAAAQIAGLRAAAEQVERPPELGPLEISVTPRGAVDRAIWDAYAAVGVDRVIVYPLPLADVGDVERFIRAHAELLA
jgi:alkanesulfonate monooxygenase SsuD/methylene tetrahydromethanopterin reductase-like flavin-dependent oxidoreductase (luciferase family)